MEKADAVTGNRYFSRKLSQSRNDEEGWNPNACHYCREPFVAGQMRYPILACRWELASGVGQSACPVSRRRQIAKPPT
jgi:hypothetical protein